MVEIKDQPEDSVTLLAMADQFKTMSTAQIAETLIKKPFTSLTEEVSPRSNPCVRRKWMPSRPPMRSSSASTKRSIRSTNKVSSRF